MTCKKMRHVTEVAANDHWYCLIKACLADQETLKVYYCTVCQAWHVGNLKKWETGDGRITKSA